MKDIVDVGLRAPSAGPLEKILSSQRRKLFDAFMNFIGDGDSGAILEVCAHSTLLGQQESYLQAWSEPYRRSRITACTIGVGGVRDADRGKYQRSDGRQLAYADGEFDWVFCSDVIEHAGSFERQYELLKELARVARKGVFLATSNRWHPLEFHTGLPLLHWLPGSWWRRLLKLSGRPELASHAGLHLLGSRELYRLASLLPGSPANDVGHVRLAVAKAHFFLMVEKRRA